jgi:beta-lactam-binding protein with PASTA domain
VTRNGSPEALPEPTIAPEASPSVEPSPSAGPELPEVVVVPDVTNVSAEKGTALMTDAFLTPNVRYKQDPRNNGKVDQSIPAGTQVPRGATVDIIIHVSIAVPDSRVPARTRGSTPTTCPP